ncbi:hypothetical protein ACWEQ7_23330 [Streptomyces sp. NPDC004069]
MRGAALGTLGWWRSPLPPRFSSVPSASSLVYATLDDWRRQMVEQGYDLLDAALHRAEHR